MKEKELYTEFELQKSVYYVEKEDNSYGPIVSGSQLCANYLDDFFLKRKNLEKKLREQMIANQISPVFFYMTMQEMGPKDLARRMGISLRKLKKVFKPVHFKKLRIEKLKVFADIFNIPVSNLFQTILINEEDRENLKIEQTATGNELFHITKVSVK